MMSGKGSISKLVKHIYLERSRVKDQDDDANDIMSLRISLFG